MYLAKGNDSDTCVYDCRVSCLCLCLSLFLFQDSYGDDPVKKEEGGINIELLDRTRKQKSYKLLQNESSDLLIFRSISNPFILFLFFFFFKVVFQNAFPWL